jgi:catecholate siderophore receptor
VVKPVEPVSLYASATRAFVPRAGEQLSSLTAANAALDPEEFRNYEIGAKWSARSSLSLTAAAYLLDRTNVAVPDPVDPAVMHLVDGQRTKGVELSISGRPTKRWSIIGAYAYQDGEITSSLSPTAQAGATLAQLSAHSFSLWNKVQVHKRWSGALGSSTAATSAACARR